ncbi:TPA: hypothetical protein ACSP2K_003922 [Aeromonas veronii]|uniref:hypothetical protein n=1 Tax=uncultured Aeromonas sp. TaxID=263763 RepID=UPI002596CED8|nr:hypothetical protein [uncultured Aeromonas sp.]
MRALFLTALLLATPVWATQDKAQALYDLAVIPWEQGKKEGWAAMLNAAEAGNVEALCTIARAYQGTSLIVSEKADKYFEMAAERNGLCGMLALANLGSGPILNNELGEVKKHTNWRQKVVDLAKSQAEQGNIYAIKTYAFIQAATGSDNGYCQWMEKAAKLGDADAMKQLASAIEDGCGWYLIPGSRQKAVHYWIEQAANHGNPRAMEKMARFAYDAGDFKGMLAWFDKAIDTGNENSLAMASYFLMEDDITSMPLPEQYQDPVKAYSLNYILWQYNPNNNDEDFSPSINLKNLDKKLTKAEKDQAMAWAKEWMKGHQVRTYGLVFN